MRWIKVLLGGALLTLLGGCVIIFILGASPSDWATAYKIRCTEIEVLGTDDTPTTITEAASTIIVEGNLAAYGEAYFGQDDSVRGLLGLYGHASGDASALLRMYTSDDYDDAINYYQFHVFEDDLLIGPDTDINAITIKDDGKVDLTAGLKLLGTAVTPTAAELNFNDGSIAGTAVASKTLVLGADKDIDTIDITKNGLEIDGNAVTVTAAEANFNDGATSVPTANKVLVLDANKRITSLEASATTGYAITGVSDGTGGGTFTGGTYGVRGTTDQGAGIGVYGTTSQTQGVYGFATGAGEGVYGSSVSGYGVFSDGDSCTSGTHTVIDELKLSKDKLKIDNTAVTTTAGEVNLLDNMWASVSTSATDGANGTAAVQFGFLDDAGTTMTTPVAGFFYMSEVATGLASAPADTSLVVLTNGEVQNVDAAIHNGWRFITSAAGLLGMTINAADDDYYIVFMHPTGKLVISSAITVSGN